MAEKTAQPWHTDGRFPPYAFLHVLNAREERKGHSLINRGEAQIALAIYQSLVARDRSLDLASRVAVIATYRAQLFELQRVFRAEYGPSITARIDFNTVDGVQGQEKDIVILSCVRGTAGTDEGSGGIGFLSDVRRMNVALTRARSSLWILGNAGALEDNADWAALIADARERNAFREVDRTYFERKAVAPVVSHARPV